MGAISQITDSISSALGTDGGGGGILGALSSLQSSPLVQAGELGAAGFFGGEALGLWGGGGGSLFGSATSAAAPEFSDPTIGEVAYGPAGGSLAGATPDVPYGPAGTTLAGTSALAGANAAVNASSGTSAAPAAPASQTPGFGAQLLNLAQTPKGALSLGTDLYSVYQGQQLNAAAQKYASAQDPMAPYRAQYAQQLAALNADPSKLTSLPGYQAGLEATQRSLAATGQATSGAGLAQLAGYGQNFYQNQVNSLAGLATLGSAGGQAGASVLGAQSLANKADVSAGLNIASLFAQ